jgi:fucose permease
MVVGISLAIVGAVLTAASPPDHMPSMALGVGLFIAGAAIGVAFASNLPHSTLNARQSDAERSEDNANGASMPWSFRDSIASMQFGPTPSR